MAAGMMERGQLAGRPTIKANPENRARKPSEVPGGLRLEAGSGWLMAIFWQARQSAFDSRRCLQ